MNHGITRTMNNGENVSMKPQAWYWRKALREAQDVETLRAHAETLVTWLERDKAAFRSLGMVPPKHGWAPGEREDKLGA